MMSERVYEVSLLGLEEVTKYLSPAAVEIYICSSWGQSEAGFRSEIRNFLSLRFGVKSKELPNPIYKRSISGRWISVSHCMDYGMVVISKFPIGCDIETTLKVNPKVIKRISHSLEDVTVYPNAAIWTAKEAAFKLLAHYKQPSSLSLIRLGDWRSIGCDAHFFTLKNIEEFGVFQLPFGMIFRFDHCTCAVLCAI